MLPGGVDSPEIWSLSSPVFGFSVIPHHPYPLSAGKTGRTALAAKLLSYLALRSGSLSLDRRNDLALTNTTPIDGVDHQPKGPLPSPEVFQEASDWPSGIKGLLPYEAALACPYSTLPRALCEPARCAIIKEPLPGTVFARTIGLALWTGCGCRSLCGHQKLTERKIGGKKPQDYSRPDLVGLCRKQVEGEKVRRCQAFRAVRSR